MTSEVLRNWISVAEGFLLGGGLAILYLALLWFSVQRIPHASRPGAWLLVTAVFRLVIIAAAFVWMIGGSWQRLAGCLAGFIIVRWAMVNRIGSRIGKARKGEDRAH